MRRGMWSITAVLVAACSALPTDPIPAHGVDIVVSVTHRSADGDSVTILITNRGSHTAFLSRCGSSPLLLVQQAAGANWTGGVQNFMCPVPPESGPIALAAADTLMVVRVFSETGRYRFRMPVATTQGLSDATQAASNAFDVP